MTLFEEQLERVSDEKIRMMRQFQIDFAQADYVIRVKELDGGRKIANVVAELVAYGVVGARGKA